MRCQNSRLGQLISVQVIDMRVRCRPRNTIAQMGRAIKKSLANAKEKAMGTIAINTV